MLTFVPITSASGRTYRVNYNPDTRVLTVVYPECQPYQCVATAEEFAALVAAQSKGGYINAHLKGRLVAANLSVQPPGPPFLAGDTVALREPQARLVQTFEAEGCCHAPLGRTLLAGKLDAATSWDCPICGAEYRPRLVGTVRHWEYHVDIAMIPV